eukprot:998341-Pyramimonas_sp.AAC.1
MTPLASFTRRRSAGPGLPRTRGTQACSVFPRALFSRRLASSKQAANRGWWSYRYPRTSGAPFNMKRR